MEIPWAVLYLFLKNDAVLSCEISHIGPCALLISWRTLMRTSKIRMCSISLALILISGSIGLAQEKPPDRLEGKATVEVRLLIIPFFVVDKKGKPVTDLRPDEVEILIDGKPVRFDYFDRYIFKRETTRILTEKPSASQKPKTSAPEKPAARRKAPVPSQPTVETLQTPRQIILIFDTAFSTRRGLFRSRNLALDLVKTFRDNDRVYILAYSALKGLRSVVGPISGQDRVREIVEKIFDPKKSVEQLNLDQDVVLDDITSRLGFSTLDEFRNVLEENLSFNRWRYQTAAVRLADAFQGLGLLLMEVPGPKIIYYFSQGIRSDLYFSGDAGPSINSAGLGMTSTRFSRINELFETPLKTLADSGAITMFINTEGGLSQGQDTLRHMASQTGGLYVGGTDLKKVGQLLENWTSAYYEVSYRQKVGTYEGKRHKVEVRVKRPGVRVLTIRGVREPKKYRYFNKQDKELYAIELAYRGDMHARYRPVEASFSKLPVRPTVRDVHQQRRVSVLVRRPGMRFDHAYDVFSVVIESPRPGELGAIKSVRDRSYRIKDGNLVLRETLNPDKGYVWAVIVIDRETGQTFWRRWYFPPRMKRS